MGRLEILNVGEGDIAITYDAQDAPDCIRAKRIITDMLRRGYALLVEVGKENDGRPIYQRATAFDETAGEYIIADYAPEAHEVEADRGEEDTSKEDAAPEPETEAVKPKKRGRPRKSVPMESATAVGVGRSAGG